MIELWLNNQGGSAYLSENKSLKNYHINRKIVNFVNTGWSSMIAIFSREVLPFTSTLEITYMKEKGSL